MLSLKKISSKYNIKNQNFYLFLNFLQDKDILIKKKGRLAFSVKGQFYGKSQKGDKGSYLLFSEEKIKPLIDEFLEEQKEAQKKEIEASSVYKQGKALGSWRNRLRADFRATDGHLCRSQGEVLIDNYFYNNKIIHAYEKRLPIKEEVYSDFYLPEGDVYIEYVGLEGDKAYDKRMNIKKELYKKYNLNLLIITSKDLKNLDDVLPYRLLDFKQ